MNTPDRTPSPLLSQEGIHHAITAHLLDRLRLVDQDAAAQALESCGSRFTATGLGLALSGTEDRQLAQFCKEVASAFGLAAGVSVIENPDTEETIAHGSIILLDTQFLDEDFCRATITHASSAAAEQKAVVLFIGTGFTNNTTRMSDGIEALLTAAPLGSVALVLVNPQMSPASESLSGALDCCESFRVTLPSPPRATRPGL
jgi:hypothetical protein